MERLTATAMAGLLAVAVTACGGSDGEVTVGTASSPADPGEQTAPETVVPTASGDSTPPAALPTTTPSSDPSPISRTSSDGGPDRDEPQPAPRALTEDNAGSHYRMEPGTTLELVLDAGTSWEVSSDDDALLVVPMQSMGADDARWEIRAQEAGHATLTARGDDRSLTWEITVP